ncbi:IS3 family transposase [Arthrobacter tecti]|uniref:Putative transposase n=2 Tax=Arthrobacter pigmenti TaxID=271432 RepID=A0A846RNQ1_9MICC|nr:putative transposase [Arthrobacter pigmenti]
MSVVRACLLTGYPKASFYRHCSPPEPKPDPIPQADRYQPAALGDRERAAIIEALGSEEYADFSVCQVFYRAWDDGNYICSRSSWYRVAREHQLTGDRRRQATASPKKIPELTATAPNQVWSWDITKLHGPRRGEYFHLYVITDIYSRFVTGWRLEAWEDGELAKQMVADAVEGNGKAPQYLHSDNGAAMISQPLSVLLAKLGVDKSFSRPGVSNDNPYSEAFFKTFKYDLRFPGSFETYDQALAFCNWFFYEYNNNHRHSAIGWHTPANMHHRRTTQITTARRQCLDKAWRKNPHRYAHRPKPPGLPGPAHINNPINRKSTNLSHTG